MLFLERPLTLADKRIWYILAHDCQTKVAKLVTFAASLVAKFFYPPWQPKWSQLRSVL